MSEMKLDARELQLQELFDEQRKKISALEEKLVNADYQLEGRDNEIRELENQQKIDAEHILTLQNEKGELTDRVKELEAQIEKIKCCENCVHHCEMLKTIHDLNERNKILEAQIEKMKCCEICANSKDWRNRSLCVECERSKTHINFVLRR